MHRTTFAGLTAPDPDDAALQVDGGSFVNRNPDLTDYFLSIGAISHKHDAHPPLASPDYAPSAIVLPSGGSIESGLSLYFGWTATDAYGGETVLSPPTVVTTPDATPPPEADIIGEFVSSAGVMPTGSFSYALTVMDATGGESVLGPAVTVDRPPGYASGGVILSNLTADLVNDGDRWRLYRSDNGGPYNLISVGTLDDFWDYGIDPVDEAAQPPLDNGRVHATASVLLTLPMPSGASANTVLTDPHATAINLYLSLDGSFGTPALVQTFPVASAGTTVQIFDTTAAPGAPPQIATSIRGANQIDPDTDLIDWHWKRPVATAADLPLGSGTASGDVRVVLNEGRPYNFIDGAWGVWSFTSPDDDSAFLTNVLFEDANGVHQVLASAVEFRSASALGVGQGTDGHAIVYIPSATSGGGGGGASGTSLVAYAAGSPGASGISRLRFVGAADTAIAVADNGGGEAQVTVTTPKTGVAVTGSGFTASGDAIEFRASGEQLLLNSAPGDGHPIVTIPSGNARGVVVAQPSGAIGSGVVAPASAHLGKSYRLMRASASGPVRLRVYASQAKRDADLNRPIGTAPSGNHGLIYERLELQDTAGATIYGSATTEDFATNTTAPPGGFVDDGGSTTGTSNHIHIISGDTTLQTRWTGGGNIGDTDRVTAKTAIDYTFTTSNKQGICLVYRSFSAGLTIGHDGAGNLALWTGNPVGTGAAPVTSVAMTGGKPANGTTIWFRGTRNGNTVLVEEFRTDPALGGAANTSFTYTLTGTDATNYGSGVTGFPMGIMGWPDHSLNGWFDDLKIERSPSVSVGVEAPHLITPAIAGFNIESPPNDVGYLAITNLGATVQPAVLLERLVDEW